ncbi:Deoxycytidylate deaminase [Handroanthus impetiginosus]|uniref:Riboflavin biosynthesis protein PYRD, chloroplastic n=1 Tax=Handroanthus impetiginosus TaxID=429701 RepID=A0A2G9HZB3_9LAMI|nr:Deoxycytidylate deaminase [Handroanthus impetiginosus]
MYAQTLPFPKHIVQNPPLKHQPRQKVAFSPKPELGFFNSAKRVSQSSVNTRTSRNMSVIRCSGSQEKQELKQEDKYDDGYYIRRCVEIARKAIGHTSPNPMVGCVIVKDGKIVGEGFHPKAGQPHAEVFALRDAGDLAENATAYVSLEPCNHYGRTPPCTEALIKAKVKNVIIGMVDPNPIVASTGVEKLQNAGIGVTVGVEEELCRRLIEAYIHRMMTGRPFVTLRYSMSVDGHILNKLGEDAMECGGYYSKLLQEYDAIIFSSTSLADKSSVPMSKEPGANQPLTIVLSKHPNPITQIPAFNNDTTSKLTIISDKGTSLEPQTGRQGIEMLSLERISLLEILEYCNRQRLCSVLLDLMDNNGDLEDILKEGLEQNMFQKVVVEVLPDLGGDQERVLKYMNLKEKVKRLTSYVSGKSVVLEGYF